MYTLMGLSEVTAVVFSNTLSQTIHKKLDIVIMANLRTHLLSPLIKEEIHLLRTFVEKCENFH